MKLLKISLFTLIAFCLTGCERLASTPYDQLKTKTGATDKELEEGIKLYTAFYVLMRDEIEAGTLKVEDMLEAAKGSKQKLTDIERDDELAAAYTLSFLRTFESKGSEQARDGMAKQLSRFVEAEFPSTESSKMIREKIREYAKTSEAFRALKQKSEQDGGEQPATRSESK